MMISLLAEPPSSRTMSPWRRSSSMRNGGWFGDCGMPFFIGCERSNIVAFASAAKSTPRASAAVVVIVWCLSLAMSCGSRGGSFSKLLRSDDAVLGEPGDLLLGEAELGEDGRVV